MIQIRMKSQTFISPIWCSVAIKGKFNSYGLRFLYPGLNFPHYVESLWFSTYTEIKPLSAQNTKDVPRNQLTNVDTAVQNAQTSQSYRQIFWSRPKRVSENLFLLQWYIKIRPP